MGNNNRAGKQQHLLSLLAELKQTTGMKRAEQFDWFVKESNVGERCGYAKQALRSFFTNKEGKHFKEVKSLLCDIMEIVKWLENNDAQ